MFRILSILTLLSLGLAVAAESWEAGFAKVDISPTESVPLAGYGGKTRRSERLDHPIWIKAMALRHEGGSLPSWSLRIWWGSASAWSGASAPRPLNATGFDAKGSS